MSTLTGTLPPGPGTYGLGVDLGTTYTAAAVWRNGRAETVPLGTRAHTVPSVLYLRDDDVLLVGEAAVRRGATDPDRVAREFKRGFGDGIPFLLGDREVTAEELVGQLLRWVVDEVTAREGGPPAHVTLTHPAGWGAHRTELLVTAAEEAGLAGVGLLVEPVAAAAYYASTERLAPGAALAVYDLGGGTFDATVVRKTATGFAVEGTPGGDDALGGVDFDQAVMDHVTAVVGPAWRSLDLDEPAVLAAVARVRELAVDAKEALSTDVEATVPVLLPGVTRDVRITRREFEAAVRIPLLRSVDLLAQAVESAGVALTDLASVLLIGGSSRIPLVSRLVAEELGTPVGIDAHPKYAVCLGAAIAAGARLAPRAPARPRSGPPPRTAPPLPPPRPTAPRPTAPRAAAPPSARPAPTGPPTAPPSGTPPTRRPGGAPPPIVRPTPPRTAPPTAPPPTRQPGAAPLTTPPRPAPVHPAPVRPTAAPAAAVPAARAPAVEAPAVVEVDLPATGITGTVDTAVATTPTTPSWTPRLLADDEPLTVTITGDRRRGVRVAVLTAAAAVLVLAVAVGVAVVLRPGSTPTVAASTDTAAPTASVTAAPAATAGTARLVAEPVTGAPGDRMRAVTATATGAVAVGTGADGTPRAWRTDASGAWVPAALDGPNTLVGALDGVAAAPGRSGMLVAVGWVAPRPAPGAAEPDGAARRGAVWTSTDGARWRLRTDNLGRAGLGELDDVVAGRDGGFVAAGIDWATDPQTGDGAVLTSADGIHWQALPVVGLGGRGQTVVRRLLVDGGGYLAVGSRSENGLGQPAVWTSPDAVTWTAQPTLPHDGVGGGEATGVVRAPGGPLVVTGTVSTVGGRSAAVWSGAGPAQLAPRTVDGGPGSVDGMAVRDGRLTAVGAGDTGAAAWTVTLDP